MRNRLQQKNVKSNSIKINISDIAVVFTHVNYQRIPFTHLQQLADIGILEIYILLNEHEIKEIENNKFVLFDDDSPKSILTYYQSQSNLLNFKFIQTGKAITEEEKLTFYLNNIEKNHIMNIVLSKESLPWTTNKLNPTFRCLTQTTITCSLFNFFHYTQHHKIPSTLRPCSTDKALELLQGPNNPCICYQLSLIDIPYYQWLYNIFVELIALKLATHENADLSKALTAIINEHNTNVINLESAEEDFNKSHSEIYLLENIDFLTKLVYEENSKYKDNLEYNFIKIISKLVNFYLELASSNQYNDSKMQTPLAHIINK